MADTPKEWPTWDAQIGDFGRELSVVCSRLALAAMADGVKEPEAVTAVIQALLTCAAGQACRNAVNLLGREPDAEKWRVATDKAFAKAVKRTSAISKASITQKVES